MADARRRAPDIQGQRIFCIVAAQRSGTTALANALARTTRFTNFGEIFQIPDSGNRISQKSAASFFQFIEANKIGLTEMSTTHGATQLAERYMAFLKQRAVPNDIVIDVKLNAWRALAPAWGYPTGQPHFLRYLKTNAAFFIFVWRENLADQVVSTFIARKLNVWHNLTAELVSGRSFTAPVRAMRNLAVAICEAESIVRANLAKYRHRIEIPYERLFENGNPTRQFLDEFSAAAQLDLKGVLASSVRPNSVPKREIVTNYDEVVAAVDQIAARYRTAPPRRMMARAIADEEMDAPDGVGD